MLSKTLAVATGAGGMGEVYRATDSRLKRSVAIKVLPASVAGDADRLARFQREAEVLAALNHPNIAAIYGLDNTADFTALVMELVEGDDLSQRIARGAIPVDEALPIAKGSRVAFGSTRSGVSNLFVKPSNGVGVEQVLLVTPNPKYARDWSHDGRFLLYSNQDPKTGIDLWALPMTGPDKAPVPVAHTAFEESNGQFSPDDHFVAYETNGSGQFEVVVQTFPQPSGKWQVSLRGGMQPRWRADSKELYFLGADGMMMAAPVTIAGATFSAGTPVPLFPAHIAAGGGANKQNYAVARDGRFLINQPVESAPGPITLILNWRPK